LATPDEEERRRGEERESVFPTFSFCRKSS
jgi:hypothetical protein